MSVFDDVSRLPPLAIWDGIVARAVDGSRLTVSVVELAPEAVIPEHRHEHEQVGMLVAGGMRFRIGGEEREAVPGTTWSIPPNVPHDVAVGPEGAVVIECFAPRRDDWDDAPRGQLVAPRWP